ncbi:unnamed protein product [Callosobruchus maculatus]|uniref:Uncharacterized protein n=1 Tax=Callosobruchus maculatus TaxID=64391 RepID=A0A653DJV6_CALMS|nr:unnamed protein product [Callosobruchus maculatus]
MKKLLLWFNPEDNQEYICQPSQPPPVRMPKNNRNRMRLDYNPPQVLSQVLDTIASMKDTSGSPLKRSCSA